MENKIQELTDKIYREGVEKGNEEAQRLISSAHEEAAKIVELILLLPQLVSRQWKLPKIHNQKLNCLPDKL